MVCILASQQKRILNFDGYYCVLEQDHSFDHSPALFRIEALPDVWYQNICFVVLNSERWQNSDLPPSAGKEKKKEALSLKPLETKGKEDSNNKLFHIGRQED